MEGTKARLPAIGLALSGGGFRASLFHLGSLWRLNEEGLLPQVSEVTSVSGGSIVGAYLGLKWKDLEFDEDGVAANYQDLIVDPIRRFCSRTIDIWAVGGGAALPFVHPGHILANSYRKHLFGTATLQELPDPGEGPRFTIYATSLQTGASVRLAKPYLADYRIGYLRRPLIPLYKAVAASSAFPPFLNPVFIQTNPDNWKPWRGTGPEYAEDSWGAPPEKGDFDDDRYRNGMWLGDGGIYDNMGLERVWDRYATVLVSDAGAPFSFKPWPLMQKWSWLNRGMRANSIITEQARSLRRRRLFQYYITGQAEGAYWGIGRRIQKYELVKHGLGNPMVEDDEVTRSIGRIKTRLNSFSEMKQAYLINWGYALTDAAIRRFMPSLTTGPGQWPVQKYALDDPDALPVRTFLERVKLHWKKWRSR